MRVSVYIPTFNRARFLAAAVESALAQSEPPDEVLVVDDGSEDDTAAVLAALRSPSLRIVRRPHEGLPRTRNFAISESTGDVLIALGSDDALTPGAVAAHKRNFARDPGLDVSYGDWTVTDEHMVPRSRIRFQEWRGRSMALLGRLALENAMPDGGTAIRRAVLERVGGYDESFPRAQDYDFWSRALPGASVGHCGETTLAYRWHSGNTSAPTVRYDVSYEARIRERLVESYPPADLFPDVDFDRLRTLAAGRGIVIWGAGSLGRTILRVLERAAVPVRAVADANPALVGTTVSGVGVVAPSTLTNAPAEQRPFVLLASVKYPEMARELDSRGWLGGSDFEPFAELTYA